VKKDDRCVTICVGTEQQAYASFRQRKKGGKDQQPKKKKTRALVLSIIGEKIKKGSRVTVVQVTHQEGKKAKAGLASLQENEVRRPSKVVKKTGGDHPVHKSVGIREGKKAQAMTQKLQVLPEQSLLNG